MTSARTTIRAGLLGLGVCFWVAAFPQTLLAQDLTIDLGGDSLSGRALQLIALITVLSLAPGLAVDDDERGAPGRALLEGDQAAVGDVRHRAPRDLEERRRHVKGLEERDARRLEGARPQLVEAARGDVLGDPHRGELLAAPGVHRYGP
ncbi:MAG: hypothetical protein ACOCYW_01125, partial [Roseicyclus sp.]